MPPYRTRSNTTIPDPPVTSINNAIATPKRSKSSTPVVPAHRKPPKHVYGKRSANNKKNASRDTPPASPPIRKAKVARFAIFTPDESSSEDEDQRSVSSESWGGRDVPYKSRKRATTFTTRKIKAIPQTEDSSDLSEDDGPNAALEDQLKAQRTLPKDKTQEATSEESARHSPKAPPRELQGRGEKRKSPSLSPAPEVSDSTAEAKDPASDISATTKNGEDEGSRKKARLEEHANEPANTLQAPKKIDERVADAIQYGFRHILLKLADNLYPSPVVPAPALPLTEKGLERQPDNPSPPAVAASLPPAKSAPSAPTPPSEPQDPLLTERRFRTLWWENQRGFLMSYERIRSTGNAASRTTAPPAVPTVPAGPILSDATNSTKSDPPQTTSIGMPVMVQPTPSVAHTPLIQQSPFQQALNVPPPAAPRAPPRRKNTPAEKPSATKASSSSQGVPTPTTPLAEATPSNTKAASTKSTVVRFRLPPPDISKSTRAPNAASQASVTKERIHLSRPTSQDTSCTKQTVQPHQPQVSTPLRESHTVPNASPSPVATASPSTTVGEQGWTDYKEQSSERHRQAFDTFASADPLPLTHVEPPLHHIPPGLQALIRQQQARARPNSCLQPPATSLQVVPVHPRVSLTNVNGLNESWVRSNLAKYAYVPTPGSAGISMRTADQIRSFLSDTLPTSGTRRGASPARSFRLSPDTSPEPGEVD